MQPSSPTPVVSVVVRNYNRGPRLLRALASVLAQSFDDLELVLVDDASTDGSAAAARAAFGDDPRLRLVTLQANVGAGEAANVGVRESRAALVAFLDSDDVWHRDFLRHQLQALADTPTAGLAYCDYIEVWESLAQSRPMTCGVPQHGLVGMLLGGCIHSMSLTVVRRRAIELAGGFEARYSVSHDYYLWLQMALRAQQQPFVHVPRPLVLHHRSDDGVTSDHERWLAEYRDAVQRGYADERAAPYRHLQPHTLHHIAIGIITRRKVGEWLQRSTDAMVSVLLRCRGDAGRAREALAQLDAQQYRNFEVVLLDASVDPHASAELAAVAEADDARYQYLRLDSDSSAAEMLNLGLAAARGELVAVLDDGQRWTADFLHAQVRAHSYVAGSPDFSCCDARLSGVRVQAPTPTRSDLLLDALLAPTPLPVSAYVFRRERLLALQPPLNDALQHAEAVAWVVGLLATRSEKGEPHYLRHPPVHIARVLLEGPGLEGCGDASRARADLQASLLTITNTLLDSAAGERYAFIDEQIVAAQVQAAAAAI